MNAAQFIQWLDDPAPRPLVMGILNVTPDSFSDGGQFATGATALAQAHRLIEEGADLLDIGGESTRPGSARIPADQQIARVVPVIAAIRQTSDIALSLDSTLCAVAEAAVAAGANLLNDISAGGEDPQMLAFAARARLPIILMHMRGSPGTMQDDPVYDNVTLEVADYLRQRAAAARAAGVPASHILLDPGIGFGKTLTHNLTLLRQLPALRELGHRLLLGVSRKRFIGSITGVAEAPQRVHGSVAAALWCVLQGASIVRVHDVAATLQALKVLQAIQSPR